MTHIIKEQTHNNINFENGEDLNKSTYATAKFADDDQNTSHAKKAKFLEGFTSRNKIKKRLVCQDKSLNLDNQRTSKHLEEQHPLKDIDEENTGYVRAQNNKKA